MVSLNVLVLKGCLLGKTICDISIPEVPEIVKSSLFLLQGKIQSVFCNNVKCLTAQGSLNSRFLNGFVTSTEVHGCFYAKAVFIWWFTTNDCEAKYDTGNIVII